MEFLSIQPPNHFLNAMKNHRSLAKRLQNSRNQMGKHLKTRMGADSEVTPTLIGVSTKK